MRVLMLLVLAFCSSPLAAAELDSADAAVELADEAMARIAAGDLRGGLESLKGFTIVPVAEFDAMIGQAELHQPMMYARFGKSTGYELLRNDTVGSSLVQLVYLHKYEKHATVWRFLFYRSDRGWVLNSFKYVDDITTAL